MAQAITSKRSKPNNGANVGYDAELWRMAEALRGSIEAAEYKHVVLGLIFLKYNSDAFEDQHAKVESEKEPRSCGLRVLATPSSIDARLNQTK